MNNIEFLEKQIALHQSECDKASNEGDFDKFSRHDNEANNYKAMLDAIKTRQSA